MVDLVERVDTTSPGLEEGRPSTDSRRHENRDSSRDNRDMVLVCSVVADTFDFSFLF